MKLFAGDVIITRPFDVDTDKGVYKYTGGLALVQWINDKEAQLRINVDNSVLEVTLPSDKYNEVVKAISKLSLAKRKR